MVWGIAMTATNGDKGKKGETGTCRACGRDVELTFVPGRRDIGLQAHWYGMCNCGNLDAILKACPDSYRSKP